MSAVKVEFTKLDSRAKEPRNAYGNDAGWDLFVLEDTEIPMGTPVDVRTGLAVAIPEGYFGRIVHRSSAPRKRGLMILEGIIDAGFRGELFSCVYAWERNFVMHKLRGPWIDLTAGDSIAQLIVQPVPSVRWVEVSELSDAQRGARGFGSSGN